MSSSPQIQSPQATVTPVPQNIVEQPVIEEEQIKGKPIFKLCVEHDNMYEEIKRISDKTGLDYKKDSNKLIQSYLKTKIWPAGSVINVGFMGNPQNIPRIPTSVLKKSIDRNGIALLLDPIQYEIDLILDIRKAIMYIVLVRLQPIVNVKFNFYDITDPEKKTFFNPNIADIRIDFDLNSTCWSLLGTDCLIDKTKPSMNFSIFDSCTVLHEFCHALGMVHEHSNMNDTPIKWSVCSLQNEIRKRLGWDSNKIQNKIIEKYQNNQYNGDEFDPKSIMLYFYPGKLVCKGNSDDLGINTSDVSKTRDLLKKCQRENLSDDCDTPGNVPNQNLALSPRDVLHLNTIYKITDQKLTPPQFTVKFFNDVYNQQIDIDTLINSEKPTPAPTKIPTKAAPKAHALKNKVQPTKKIETQHALKQPQENEKTELRSGKFYERLNENIMNGNFENLFLLLFLIFWLISLIIPSTSFLNALKDNWTNIIGLALVVEFIIFYIAEMSYGFNILLYKLLSTMKNFSPISEILSYKKSSDLHEERV
jgi:hypothetical protein